MNPVNPFDIGSLSDALNLRNAESWGLEMERRCRERFSEKGHGKLPSWIDAWSALPEPNPENQLLIEDGFVCVSGRTPDHAQLTHILMQMHPWRKGPFRFQGITMDTEWRSDLKWNRIQKHIELSNRAVLDVGCGNGYFGWHYLAGGANLVVGLDPMLLYVMQFEVFRRYSNDANRHFVLPATDADIPKNLHAFDTTLSMGVLYHRTSPIDHLHSLWHSLRKGGQLVLETLVVESSDETVLVPENRYAKMRNVWFLPSVPMLCRWLRRTGFTQIQLIDQARTTGDEQRTTDWMTFQSLSDFLSPDDRSKTIEGYPAPMRAVIVATRGD